MNFKASETTTRLLADLAELPPIELTSKNSNNNSNRHASMPQTCSAHTLLQQSNASGQRSSTKPAYGSVILSLENFILPQEQLQQSPSNCDGLSPDDEYDLRLLGCEIIQRGGILLKLPQAAMATGQVLFHRFYYRRSFVSEPMEHVAMACIALASKIDEAPRRMRDVINVVHHLQQLDNGVEDPEPMLLHKGYPQLKHEVVKAERRLLKELGFCVHVKHPHKFILAVINKLVNEREHNEDDDDEDEKMRKRLLRQTAWNYMNDSLRTDLFVRYPPETIACACIHLSARLLKMPFPEGRNSWYNMFGASTEDIQDASYRILRLYTRKRPDRKELEQKIQNLKSPAGRILLKATNGTSVIGNSPNVDKPSKKELQSNSKNDTPSATSETKQPERSGDDVEPNSGSHEELTEPSRKDFYHRRQNYDSHHDYDLHHNSDSNDNDMMHDRNASRHREYGSREKDTHSQNASRHRNYDSHDIDTHGRSADRHREHDSRERDAHSRNVEKHRDHDSRHNDTHGRNADRHRYRNADRYREYDLHDGDEYDRNDKYNRNTKYDRNDKYGRNDKYNRNDVRHGSSRSKYRDSSHSGYNGSDTDHRDDYRNSHSKDSYYRDEHRDNYHHRGSHRDSYQREEHRDSYHRRNHRSS